MKLRHVRAVAIAVGVVVTLTGARHHSGGGCSSSHSSSNSHSSTSGGHHYDDDDDVDVDVPDIDTDSSGGATDDATSGSGSSAETADDLDIESCVYDESRGLVARVTATNSSATTSYTYDFTVTFKDPTGTTITSTDDTISYVPATETKTQEVAAPYVPDTDDATNGTCELTNATRTAV